MNTYKTKWKNANISKTTKTQRSPICVHSNFMCCGSVTYTCDKIIIRMILWNFCTATFCGLESVAFLFQLSNYPYYKYWSKCRNWYFMNVATSSYSRLQATKGCKHVRILLPDCELWKPIFFSRWKFDFSKYCFSSFIGIDYIFYFVLYLVKLTAVRIFLFSFVFTAL